MAIHRFKCSPHLNEEIQSFSRKYMFNNDADLSDNFEEWYNKPNIVMLVNIEETFLSRHDYDVPIKHKIFRNQTAKDYAIINVDNINSKTVFDELKNDSNFTANLIPISTKKINDGGVSVINNIFFCNCSYFLKRSGCT